MGGRRIAGAAFPQAIQDNLTHLPHRPWGRDVGEETYVPFPPLPHRPWGLIWLGLPCLALIYLDLGPMGAT